MNESRDTSGPPASDRRQGVWQLVLILLVVGAAVLIARYLSGMQTPTKADVPAEPRALLVDTVHVEPGTHRLQFRATGTVQVRAMTDIVPQVSGKVTEVSDQAFAGGRLDPDVVLFQIEVIDYELRVRQLQAEVAQAQTGLKLQQARSQSASAEWNRLHPDEPVPPLVGQQPQLAQARSTLRAAEARLETARLDLARTSYRLPFTGRVVEFALEEGQYAVAGQPYGTAYRLDALEIDVPVTDQQLAWMMETSDPEIQVTGGRGARDRYRGFVKRVSATVDPLTRFSQVYVGIHEPGRSLVPGAFVTVDIAGPTRTNIWALPLDTLQQDDAIWTVNADQQLVRRQPPILQVSEQRVVAESDGTTIRAVRGNMAEATEGTPVQQADASGAEGTQHGSGAD